MLVWIYFGLGTISIVLLVIFLVIVDRQQFLRGVVLSKEERIRKALLRFTFLVSFSFGMLSVVSMLETANWIHNGFSLFSLQAPGHFSLPNEQPISPSNSIRGFPMKTHFFDKRIRLRRRRTAPLMDTICFTMVMIVDVDVEVEGFGRLGSIGDSTSTAPILLSLPPF